MAEREISRGTRDGSVVRDGSGAIAPVTGININRSNAAAPEMDETVVRAVQVRTDLGPNTVSYEEPVYMDAPVSTQTASVNWILPLVILGGFYAAAKLKKKKKNV